MRSAAFTPLQLAQTGTRRKFPTLPSIRPLKRPEFRRSAIAGFWQAKCNLQRRLAVGIGQAQELGVKILDENEFLKMFE